MNCPKCSYELYKDFKFCYECGNKSDDKKENSSPRNATNWSKLECSRCKSVLFNDAKFCHNCGRSVVGKTDNKEGLPNENRILEEMSTLSSLPEYLIIYGNVKGANGCLFNEDIDENKLRLGFALAISNPMSGLTRVEKNNVINFFFEKIYRLGTNFNESSFKLIPPPLSTDQQAYIGINFENLSCHQIVSNSKLLDVLAVIKNSILSLLIQMPLNERAKFLSSIKKMTAMFLEKDE